MIRLTKRLKPGPDQREVGQAGQQQCDRKGQLEALAGGMECRFHGAKHPAILGRESRGFFFSEFTGC
jgi:hypothetical protein